MHEHELLSLIFITTLIFGIASAITVNVSAPPPTLVLPDALLLDNTEVQKQFGPGNIVSRSLIGPGVAFTLAGLDPNTGTGIGDNFPVNQLAGGALKTYGSSQPFTTEGDFCAYTSYEMIFTNPNDIPVWVNLYINTGWTIPPPEFATGARDTFFQNDWILIAPGQTRTIVLDFSSTQVWNAADDPEAGNQFPNGATGVALFRCDEVSHIGFQVRSDLGSAQSLELRVRQGIPDAPVGGISTPVNKLAVLAPYIALACVIATTVGIVAFKRAKDQ